jgi:mannose-6-phosphate isomerase-like protein (cupin superfamily)
MSEQDLKRANRRAFLVSASAAAATGFLLAESVPSFAQAGDQNGATKAGAVSAPGTFQLITAEAILNDVKALEAAPGNNNLATHNEFSVVLTTETAHSAKEFEWHEGRDHVFQVIDGTTVYELGGTPKDAHSPKPDEWLAAASEGAATVTLHKGDMLIIPRGTPHKRSTAGSVTFTLISPSGVAKGQGRA